MWIDFRIEAAGDCRRWIQHDGIADLVALRHEPAHPRQIVIIGAHAGPIGLPEMKIGRCPFPPAARSRRI